MKNYESLLQDTPVLATTANDHVSRCFIARSNRDSL